MLTTGAFDDGGIIPNKYTGSDRNPVSPKLEWTNVPAGAASFNVIMHDPDTAPQKKAEDILHGMAFNIPGSTTGLPEAVACRANMPNGAIQAKGFREAVGYHRTGALPNSILDPTQHARMC